MFDFSFISGKFCGDTKVPDVLISSKYRMLVTYRTSSNHNGHKGFKAHYEGNLFFTPCSPKNAFSNVSYIPVSDRKYFPEVFMSICSYSLYQNKFPHLRR